MSDYIHMGSRGEAICNVLMTPLCFGRSYPFFSLHYLGERHETFDYFVRLIDAGNISPHFFFVQVKTTNRGYTKQGQLRVRLFEDEIVRLKAFPTPTYIIGIDLQQEVGYIVSANADCPDRISNLPTAHPLSCNNLERLWHEVKGFWEKRDMRLQNSLFS